jgi:hypothetical protein
MRAVTLAHGWMRGLHEIGVLFSARYISSNSGGSWTTAPYCYLPTDNKDPDTVDRTFFGPYLTPDKCTVHHLQEFPSGCHSSAIADCNFEAILVGEALEILPEAAANTFLRKDNMDFWSEAVAEMFFKKYKLKNGDHIPRIYDSSGSQNSGAGQTDEIPLWSELPSLGHVKVYDVCRSFVRVPFPIINASVEVRGHTGFIPLEFTPMYYGRRVFVAVSFVEGTSHNKPA